MKQILSKIYERKVVCPFYQSALCFFQSVWHFCSCVQGILQLLSVQLVLLEWPILFSLHINLLSYVITSHTPLSFHFYADDPYTAYLTYPWLQTYGCVIWFKILHANTCPSHKPWNHVMDLKMLNKILTNDALFSNCIM